MGVLTAEFDSCCAYGCGTRDLGGKLVQRLVCFETDDGIWRGTVVAELVGAELVDGKRSES